MGRYRHSRNGRKVKMKPRIRFRKHHFLGPAWYVIYTSPDPSDFKIYESGGFLRFAYALSWLQDRPELCSKAEYGIIGGSYARI